MEIQPLQILFQIINFSAVLGALTYFLYKPILKILEERANRIEEGQAAAEKALIGQNQVEDLKKQVKHKAEKEAAKILEDAQTAAQEKRSSLLAQAKTEALLEVERVRTSWNEEKQQSMQQMKLQFTEAVIATSEKVIGQSLDTKAHSKLIEQEFEQLLKVA